VGTEPVRSGEPEDGGLRETFLVGLPPETQNHLRVIVRGLADLVTRHGLLFSGSGPEREDLLLLGLWRELGHLKRLTGSLERGATGSRRSTLRKIRVLLEDAEGVASLEVPEEWR
jgi:hypothetical protein